MQLDNAHQFALYYEAVSELRAGSFHSITDDAMINRISKILRLQKDELIILFDQQIHAVARIEEIAKKNCELKILEIKKNLPHAPRISYYLPLLKKESFESALYVLTEIGVQEIQLIITEKSRSQLAPHELERAHRIIIAAAEQSKNYAFPTISLPIKLQELSVAQSQKIFCDPKGLPVRQFLPTLNAQTEISIMIGPEGDLTSEEKKIITQQGFSFMALTTTVLRACQAASLSAGLIRSWFYKT